MHGDLPGGPETYMDGEFDNTYVLASGSSFYQQCFPPASIDLGFCATAMHWLTDTPAGGIPDALHSAASHDGPTKAAFEAQASKDWEAILLQRAKELKTGTKSPRAFPVLLHDIYAPLCLMLLCYSLP